MKNSKDLYECRVSNFSFWIPLLLMELLKYCFHTQQYGLFCGVFKHALGIFVYFAFVFPFRYLLVPKGVGCR